MLAAMDTKQQSKRTYHIALMNTQWGMALIHKSSKDFGSSMATASLWVFSSLFHTKDEWRHLLKMVCLLKVMLLLLLLYCCSKSTVNIYGHVGTIS